MQKFRCGRLVYGERNQASADFLVPAEEYSYFGKGCRFELNLDNGQGRITAELINIEMAESRRPSWTFEDFMLVRAEILLH